MVEGLPCSGGVPGLLTLYILGLLWSSKLNSIRYDAMLMRGEAASIFGGG